MLVLAYMGAMSKEEAKFASQFWRYSTHLQGLFLVITLPLALKFIGNKKYLGALIFIAFPNLIVIQKNEFSLCFDSKISELHQEVKRVVKLVPEKSKIHLLAYRDDASEEYYDALLPYIISYELDASNPYIKGTKYHPAQTDMCKVTINQTNEHSIAQNIERRINAESPNLSKLGALIFCSEDGELAIIE